MEVGVVLRNMGPQSTRETLEAAARAADALPAVADVWVVDHIAIPPDDAEGSEGRYLDPLATLAYLAGATTRVGLGTAVLVLPYRPALPTAKWIATVQELSGGRLRLGVGVGWMGAEFRAVGVDHRRRGALTDETLAFLDRCFAADVVEANGQPFLFRPPPPRPPLFIVVADVGWRVAEFRAVGVTHRRRGALTDETFAFHDRSFAADVVEANGQPFLFRPRPPRPPLFIGGAPPHAFRRALAHGAGWMPIGLDPDALRPLAADLRAPAAAAGPPAPEVAALTRLPLDDPGAARDLLVRYAEAGATRVIHGERYADAPAFHAMLDRLARVA